MDSNQRDSVECFRGHGILVNQNKHLNPEMKKADDTHILEPLNQKDQKNVLPNTFPRPLKVKMSGNYQKYSKYTDSQVDRIWKALPAQQKSVQEEKLKCKRNGNSCDKTSSMPRANKKDHHAPKRPIPSFLHFSQVMRPLLKEKNEKAKPIDVSRILGEQWQSLTADQKAPFEEKARLDKERWLKEVQKYREKVNKSPARSEKVQIEGKRQRESFETSGEITSQEHTPIILTSKQRKLASVAESQLATVSLQYNYNLQSTFFSSSNQKDLSCGEHFSACKEPKSQSTDSQHTKKNYFNNGYLTMDQNSIQQHPLPYPVHFYPYYFQPLIPMYYDSHFMMPRNIASAPARSFEPPSEAYKKWWPDLACADR